MTDRPHYTQAFRAWLRTVGDLDAAQLATGIDRRTLQRYYSGKAAPHARLLREWAIGADETGKTELGRRLRESADRLDADRETADA